MKLFVGSHDTTMRTFLALASDHHALWRYSHPDAPPIKFDVDVVDSVQELTTLLFRDPFALGALGITRLAASETVREIRLAEVLNPLFVLMTDTGEVASYVNSIVECLIAGADDVQPFPITEIEYASRLRSLARRDRGGAAVGVEFPHECRYFPARGVLQHLGGAINFSRLEAEALNLLVERPHSIVSKEMLMQRLYEERDEPGIKIIDVFICKIRRKLSLAMGGTDVIQTAWGRGYSFIPEGFIPEFGHVPGIARAPA